LTKKSFSFFQKRATILSVVGEYAEKISACSAKTQKNIRVIGEHAERIPAYSPTTPNKQNFAMPWPVLRLLQILYLKTQNK